MVVRFTAGSVFKIQIADNRAAYGVMLGTRPYFAFYSDDLAERELAVGKGLRDSPIFVVAVHKSAYSNGRWGSPLCRIVKDFLPPVPLYFRQDVLNPSRCEIVDCEGNSRPAKPEECVGLERSAVWSAEHIEKRVQDYLSGRPNSFVESMKVKL